MAVLSTATSSGRQMALNVLTTSLTSYYTAPSYSTNVTSPSATAYIKEIILCNTTSNPITVTVNVAGQPIISGLTINGNDTKILSGLNTMMPASSQIQASASSGSAVVMNISGVEVQ